MLRILDSLHDLVTAPVVAGEYHGPVLFSGDASSDIFVSLFAPAVTALRPDVGTTDLTRGAYGSSYHTRVLPESLNIVDDPSLATFQGKGLLGAYSVDDEGVPAQTVTLVDQGKLVNYLIGREPIKDFPASNGHGRSGPAGAPRPELGVLRIEAAKSLSPDELNQRLLAMEQRSGTRLGPTPSIPLAEISHRCLLYKIDVATGKRELGARRRARRSRPALAAVRHPRRR